MTDQTPDSPLPRLAVPGERFGWIFQDRNLYRRRFLEPPPIPQPVPVELVQRVNTGQAKLSGRILLSVLIGLGLAVVAGCCAGAIGTDGGGGALVVLAVAAAVGGIAAAAAVWAVHANARNTLAEQTEQLRYGYQQAYAGWDMRRVEFERGQQTAVDSMLEWGAAAPTPGTRRIDVVGGTTWGWEAVLTVLGGSLLSTRGPMLLVDFSGADLAAELRDLAAQTGAGVAVRRLPAELPQVDLLAGLAAHPAVDSLVEAMHGGDTGGSRADRAQDTMLLGEVCEALAGPPTVAKLLAGLRVLTDRPPGEELTPAEADRIRDALPDEARRQIHTSVRRIESFLRPLAAMGTDLRPVEATLTCLVSEMDGRTAQHEMLKDLAVQWLTRRVDAESAGSLVLVGADEVNHRHIERLTTVCERRGVRLVLLFEHLRESSLRAIGGGEVAFMRLANHEEARQAADFIGRQHRFVLSQLTRTLGGSDTHTVADTEGESTTIGRNTSYTRGRHGSSTRGSSWSRTRNWSQTVSAATGTNWSDAASAQRVYEYAVEPRVLQDLPDYAMLLVRGQGQGSVVQAVECDPAIVLLPRLSMDPLPHVPLPDPREAAVAPASAPPQLGPNQAMDALSGWTTNPQHQQQRPWESA